MKAMDTKVEEPSTYGQQYTVTPPPYPQMGPPQQPPQQPYPGSYNVQFPPHQQGNIYNQGQPIYPGQYSQTQPLLNPQSTIVQPHVSEVKIQQSEIHFDLALTLSCMVCFFFNCIFGTIALCIAVCGLNGRKEGNEKSTNCMLRASYHVSIIGLLISVWLWLVLLAFHVGGYMALCNSFVNVTAAGNHHPKYSRSH